MVELDALPEECIAHVLSLTTPRDAARSSAVSRTFRSASDSDDARHKFLPPDLDLIVSTSSTTPSPPPLGPSLTRKKDAFLRLCSSPLLIDSGRKSFALEKWSGKKCCVSGTRDLSIVWGDTPRYWRWSSLHFSRSIQSPKMHCISGDQGTISTAVMISMLLALYIIGVIQCIYPFLPPTI